MRRLYTLFLFLLTPFIVMRLYWKSRRLPAYRHRIGERFVLGKLTPQSIDVWVHAVSLGEVVAATPLIDAMLLKKWRVLLTTMTPTGSEQVVKRFGSAVIHQYVPYDLPWVLRRFFQVYRPRLGVIMETELWPNIITHATLAKIPLLIANGRLSDKAFRQYQKVRVLFRPILNQLTAILAQSQEDAERFIALGASQAKVQVTGNMKFDLQLKVADKPESVAFKKAWGDTRPVVIAASTHNDEEHQLLSQLRLLKEAIPEVLLVLVPRHPERFQAVFQMSVEHGFNTGRRTQPETVGKTTDVVIIDSLGELLSFYQVSDYAFVGGSLVPVGGHNVLEPIAVMVPVFCGAHMNNSKAICRDLLAAKAMTMVQTAEELIRAISKMHHDGSTRQEQVANATAVLEANRGTVSRYMEKIEVAMVDAVLKTH